MIQSGQQSVVEVEKEESRESQLVALRALVSKPEMGCDEVMEAFWIIVRMANKRTFGEVDALPDEAWREVFGRNAFEVAVALQAVIIEGCFTPIWGGLWGRFSSKLFPDRSMILRAHRRVRRLAPS